MVAKRVLVVERDEASRRTIQQQLEHEGYLVTMVADVDQADAVLDNVCQDLVIADVNLVGFSGDLLKRIGSSYPETLVLVLTDFETVKTALETVKLGVFNIVTKPLDPSMLRYTVRKAAEHLDLRQEVRALRGSLDEKYGFESIIGQSSALLYAVDAAAWAGQMDGPVLIRGETGTGKALLAKAIHFKSHRRDKPFVAVYCGAIPKQSFESELFGGSGEPSTGGPSRKGKIELADQGTLFLGEIGAMPLEPQAKLLDLIQRRESTKFRGGSGHPDVRIIASTHDNLLAMIQSGTFREDLYYRLNFISLELPPLRERTDDIPKLVQHFFAICKEKCGRSNLILPQSLLPYLCAYRWPENVRELINVIEGLVAFSRGAEITVTDLPEFLRKQRPALDVLQLELPPHGISLEAVERELILKALTKFNWNQSQTARYLDLSRKTLIYRMEKFGLRRASGEPEIPFSKLSAEETLRRTQ